VRPAVPSARQHQAAAEGLAQHVAVPQEPGPVGPWWRRPGVGATPLRVPV